MIFNKQTLVYDIVSTSDVSFDLPSAIIQPNENIDIILENTFKDYIDLDPIYTHFVLSDILNEDQLYINYYCLVPYSTKLKKGNLLPVQYDKIYSPALRQIIHKL